MADSTLNATLRALPGASAGVAPRPDRGGALAGSGDVIPPTGKERPQQPAVTDLKVAVEQINRYLTDTKRNLVFQIDEGSGRTVIRVINPETSEVIREIPPSETLVLARYGDRILDAIA